MGIDEAKYWLRIKESLIFVLIFLVLYLSLSLITFDNNIKWLPVNSAGPLGHRLAELLFTFFGIIAWVWLLPILSLLLYLWRTRYSPVILSFSIVYLYIPAFVVLSISCCGLVTLYWSEVSPMGGIVGVAILKFLLPTLGIIGSTLLLLCFCLFGITLFTGFSWLWLIDISGKLVIRSYEFIVKKGQRLKTTLIKRENLSPKKVVVSPAVMPVTQDNITVLPAIDLLDRPKQGNEDYFTSQEHQEMAKLLEKKLLDFGIEITVSSIKPGPVITRFEILPSPGLKVNKISSLATDLARSLSVVKVRVVEVIPGKSVIGIEIPNATRTTVYLSQVMKADEFSQSTSSLSLALGQDIAGHTIVADLEKMPHLLVAGTTGSGKSVAVNAMILSILYKSIPDAVRLIMIDPKMLELSVYEGIPHLLTPVVTDMQKAAGVLQWCVMEMERRYQLLSDKMVRNITNYNEMAKNIADMEYLPLIVVVIDEFADMMMIVGKKVEELIARIAQKARAAGIHLILATQRPSVDVITGLIKANIPSRIAFQVSSKIDSRTILDQSGAEQLLGLGDMLYLPPGAGIPVRVHGAFVSDQEVHRVVADLRAKGQPKYLDSIVSSNVVNNTEVDEEHDVLYDEVVAFVVSSRKSSISSVQRQFRIGYNRAANLIESLEKAGIVSTPQRNGSREVLIATQK